MRNRHRTVFLNAAIAFIKRLFFSSVSKVFLESEGKGPARCALLGPSNPCTADGRGVERDLKDNIGVMGEADET